MGYTNCKGRVRKTTPEMALYARQIAADNSGQHSRLKRNLLRATREELTERQRQVLTLYYGRSMTIYEVGAELGIHPSTVSRTLKRAEQKLFRCLRFGAGEYLKSADGGD